MLDKVSGLTLSIWINIPGCIIVSKDSGFLPSIAVKKSRKYSTPPSNLDIVSLIELFTSGEYIGIYDVYVIVIAL